MDTIQASQDQIATRSTTPAGRRPSSDAYVGSSGQTGQTGIGISNATVNTTTGDLMITYSNSATPVDVGHVVGSSGQTGQTGIGISNATVNATTGDLMITYSNSSTAVDVGHVVGPTGQTGASGASVTSYGAPLYVESVTLSPYTNIDWYITHGYAQQYCSNLTQLQNDADVANMVALFNSLPCMAAICHGAYAAQPLFAQSSGVSYSPATITVQCEYTAATEPTLINPSP